MTDQATVLRVMNLIPERVARSQSGTTFTEQQAGGSPHPERFTLLARFLHWLGPLEYATKEEQQQLGLREHARPLAADELDDDADREGMAGTPIAAPTPPSTVGDTHA